VTLDDKVARHLKPHQREGVIFLYKAITLMSGQGGGALLTDEMGLGKTLQCVAVIW
jgi:DNA repair and recombination protein RAD54B